MNSIQGTFDQMFVVLPKYMAAARQFIDFWDNMGLNTSKGRHQKKKLQNFTLGPKLPWPPYLLGHFTPEKFAPDL